MSFQKCTHQGNNKFGDSAGKQCTCCSLFSIAFTLTKSPGHWDSHDLDFIVNMGDRIYKEVNIPTYLALTELPHEISLFESFVSVNYLENKFGFVGGHSVPGWLFNNIISPNASGLLLLMKGVCISVTWTRNKKDYFLFDSHSKNECGKCCPNGYSVLLKFQSKRSLESHIIENYLERDDVNIQFEIEYVQVIKRNDEIDFSISYRQIRDRSRKSTDIEREKRRQRIATENVKRKDRERMATDEAKRKCRQHNTTDKAKKRNAERMATNSEKKRSLVIEFLS